MIIYRIDRQKYADTVLSGQGAALHGGRWNHQFTPAVYASESRALSMLEVLVNSRNISLVPRDKVIISIEVPDDYCYTLSRSEVPPYWNALPEPHTITQDLFQQYCVAGKFGGLKVPSVVMPAEFNFVLYPLHPNFAEAIKVLNVATINWDQRLGS